MPDESTAGAPVTTASDLPKADSLPSALLLAAAGGTLDAFVYLDHGHVFAGAMTGNAVLAGIALLSHNHEEALFHLLPIGAFAAGMFGAEVLNGRLRRNAVPAGLLCEMVGLFVASWLPNSTPDLLLVPWISLLAGYQVASFKRVDGYSYNSTFMTGNLRSVVEAAYELTAPVRKRGSLKKCLELSCIIAGFLAGAVAGSVLAPRAGNHTLWLPVALLLVVLLRVLLLRREWDEERS